MYIRNCHKFQFILIFIYWMLLGLSQTSFASENSNDYLLSSEQLGSITDKSDTLVIDTRGPQSYALGHIKGAINLPVDLTFSQQTSHDRLGSQAYIQQLLSSTGVKNSDHIVLYDDGNLIDAARLFWVLEVFGHSRISVLDGGFEAWRREMRATETATTTRDKSEYNTNIAPDVIATRLSTQLAINSTNTTIIDSRTEDEYNGYKSIAKRYGHIPQAINIPWHKNIQTTDGVKHLLSDSELATLYQNIPKHQRIITYCNKGKQSSLTYFVLRRLGYRASHYDGSWNEWGNDETLPINKDN